MGVLISFGAEGGSEKNRKIKNIQNIQNIQILIMELFKVINNQSSSIMENFLTTRDDQGYFKATSDATIS